MGKNYIHPDAVETPQYIKDLKEASMKKAYKPKSLREAEKENVTISIRLPKTLMDKIDTIAIINDRSRNNVIKRILQEFINKTHE
jgi:hypothetical protein